MRYLENAETQKKGKRNGRKNVTVFSMAMANVTSIASGASSDPFSQ